MNVLELFSGTHSIGVVCKQRQFNVTSLDRDLGAKSKLYDYRSTNHISEDIMTWDYKQYDPETFDLVTMSPVCMWWSKMRICRLPREKIDDDIEKYGKPMVDKCIEILDYLKPKYYWIENPENGSMKKYMAEKYPAIHNKHYIVDYCQYDDDIGYMKRTIFWTNIEGFKPKTCKGKGKCPNMSGNAHKINIASNQYVIIDGKRILTNTKSLRIKYKDHEKFKQKTTRNIYERYKIPSDLINGLIDKCI